MSYPLRNTPFSGPKLFRNLNLDQKKPLSNRSNNTSNHKTFATIFQHYWSKGNSFFCLSDALLTQRHLAEYIVRNRKAHYQFTVEANQPRLLEDIQLYFHNRQQPDFVDVLCCDHGRIELRKIWTTTALNGYLNFPNVRQAVVIEREFTDKKSAQRSRDVCYGITSRAPEQANAKCLLTTNRRHSSTSFL